MNDLEKLQHHQSSPWVHPFTCCDHQTMIAKQDAEGVHLQCPKCGLIQRAYVDEAIAGHADLEAMDERAKTDKFLQIFQRIRDKKVAP